MAGWGRVSELLKIPRITYQKSHLPRWQGGHRTSEIRCPMLDVRCLMCVNLHLISQIKPASTARFAVAPARRARRASQFLYLLFDVQALRNEGMAALVSFSQPRVAIPSLRSGLRTLLVIHLIFHFPDACMTFGQCKVITSIIIDSLIDIRSQM